MITVSKQKIHLPRLDGDDYFERICAILSPDQPMKDEDESEYDPPQFEPPRASSKTLKCYQSFLTPKLPPGLKLKAIEDAGYFAWEERFMFGAGSPKEHAAIRKERASCEDELEFVRLIKFDKQAGLMVIVKRTTDKKQFTIPLGDLTTCSEKAKEYQFLDDHAVWFCNFGPDC